MLLNQLPLNCLGKEHCPQSALETQRLFKGFLKELVAQEWLDVEVQAEGLVDRLVIAFGKAYLTNMMVFLFPGQGRNSPGHPRCYPRGKLQGCRATPRVI